MAKKKIIEVQGLEIRIEPINDEDYVSLTDIAKQQDKANRQLIIRWIQNADTLRYLQAWEILHNANFKVTEMHNIRLNTIDRRQNITPQRYIKQTNAIGIISKSGKYGGTFAHKEIALNFCYWLSPEFQVLLYKAFNELMEREYKRQSLEWHISKITDNIDEVRNLLDTIPGQKEDRNRIKRISKPKKK